MKTAINILIADDNYDFWELVKGLLSEYDDINVLDYAGDGFETIEMVKLLSPDVIVLDIVMPNLDGIAVLEQLKRITVEKDPIIIILTAIDGETFIQRAFQLGADYYMLKPIEIDTLEKRIRQLYQEKYFHPEENTDTICRYHSTEHFEPYIKDWEACIGELLNEFGIPLHVLGYKYLKDAILEELNDSDDKKSMAKDLYAKVAKKNGITEQRVERAIRNAIEIAWLRGNKDAVDYLLGYFSSFSEEKPTNSEFIALMIDRVKGILERSK